MIARVWRGRVRSGKLEEYRAYMARTGLRDLKATEGNIAAYLFARERDGYGEVIVVSLWRSSESIKAFAGDDISLARYYPDDPAFLLELPPTLDHFDVTT